MLSRLSIKNVALIESADIEFGEGLNVLSGETGAGKSVILDSVNFVLGAKADRSMIRYGETECLVKAEFDVPEEAKALQVLREMDIESDGEIIISRKFSETGKNAIKVNGNTVTVSMLRQITDSLVDVHGQSEHFFLLKESNQLKTLDTVVGEDLLPLKESLSQLLKTKKEIDARISMLGVNEQDRTRRLDLLSYQIEEIEAVDLKENEEEELLAKRNKIMHVGKILSSVQDAISILGADGGVLDGLRVATRYVSSISKFDEAYSELCDRLEGLHSEAQDVFETLSELADDLYFDENEANEIEARLDTIRALQRKYGANKAEIDEYYAKICAEYELLSDCEGQFKELTAQKEKNARQIYEICRKITNLRKTSGKAFCQRVTEELKTLNIQSAQFEIAFEDYSEEDVSRVATHGFDNICFMFSANAGEPMKPLGKIISGGEMSRFMLAIKTQLSNVNEISTYIFDEIDAGISGQTAKVVGEKLAKIAKNTQILAVSHLAQIAVMSDNEYLIEKQENNGKTLTKVYALDKEQKLYEIVRLLGGNQQDEYARKHAEELIKQAETYKKAL